MVEAYAKQKFASHQYDYSNLLLEHRDSNGNIINYGLFRRVGNGTLNLLNMLVVCLKLLFLMVLVN